MPYVTKRVFVKSKKRKPAASKTAAKKKGTKQGSGLAKFRTAIKRATAVTTRSIKAVEKKLAALKKVKAAKTKAATKKFKSKNK